MISWGGSKAWLLISWTEVRVQKEEQRARVINVRSLELISIMIVWMK